MNLFLVTVTKEGSLYFVRSGDMGTCAETITEAFRLFGELVESTSKPEPIEISGWFSRGQLLFSTTTPMPPEREQEYITNGWTKMKFQEIQW